MHQTRTAHAHATPMIQHELWSFLELDVSPDGVIENPLCCLSFSWIPHSKKNSASGGKYRVAGLQDWGKYISAGRAIPEYTVQESSLGNKI